MHTLVGFPGATGVVIVDEDLFRLGLEGRLEGANLRAALGSAGGGDGLGVLTLRGDDVHGGGFGFKLVGVLIVVIVRGMRHRRERRSGVRSVHRGDRVEVYLGGKGGVMRRGEGHERHDKSAAESGDDVAGESIALLLAPRGVAVDQGDILRSVKVVDRGADPRKAHQPGVGALGHRDGSARTAVAIKPRELLRRRVAGAMSRERLVDVTHPCRAV